MAGGRDHDAAFAIYQELQGQAEEWIGSFAKEPIAHQLAVLVSTNVPIATIAVYKVSTFEPRILVVAYRAGRKVIYS